ncbi:MAG: HDOD domain-containing protein [Planctomycetota bacterium]
MDADVLEPTGGIDDNASRASRVELVLRGVDRLPTLGGVARRVLELGSNDDVEIDELARLIETDASLTGRVLAMCRRANVGLGSQITTVESAVKMLGLEAIRSTVLSVEVYEALSDGVDEGLFDRVGYWRHALGVACCGEMLAKRLRLPSVKPEHAFVAGVLHGLGRLVLHRVLPKGYHSVIQVAEARGIDAVPIEQELIGMDHHTAGKRLAEHWGLPHAIQDVIWLHGQPDALVPDLVHRDLIRLVRVSRGVCRALRVGWSGDFSTPVPIAVLAEESGLPVGDLDGVSAQLAATVAARCEALGVEDCSVEELLVEAVASANNQLSRINGRLEKRARQAGERGAVLAAIEAFSSRERRGDTVVDTLGDVAKSAAGVFGRGTYGAVYQPRRGASWELLLLSEGGTRAETCEPPSDPGGGALDVADIFAGSAAWVGAWASERLAGLPEPDRARWLPLWSSRASTAPEGAAAALVTDRAFGERFGGQGAGGLVDVLASVWGSAVRAAGKHEGARRLGEKLAESQRRLSEVQRVLADRETMSRLEQITSGCAHEMNNPLTVIRGAAQKLSSGLQDVAFRKAAASIDEASLELADLVKSLHVLSSPREPEPVAVHPGELVREAIGEARRRMGGGVRVKLLAGEGIAPVMLDRDFLSEAVIELLRNAEASGSDDLTEVAVHAARADGRLTVRVTDRGCGMDAGVLKLAFDPFFSRRMAGRGAGLGLTRARRFVELMGGTLTLNSELGRGTTAEISLPLRPAGAPLLSDEGEVRLAA